MKMQDRIEELTGLVKEREAKIGLLLETIGGLDDDALAISEIEAIVQSRLQRRMRHVGVSADDPTNTGALVRVFAFVAEKHGVTLVRHADGSSLCVA